MDFISNIENWDEEIVDEKIKQIDWFADGDESYGSPEEMSAGSSSAKRKRVTKTKKDGGTSPWSIHRTDKYVHITNDSRNLIEKTLKGIYGKEFSVNNSESAQNKRRFTDHPESEKRDLLQNVENSSNVQNVVFDFLETLERYGFHPNHCKEVLNRTNNNFEVSLKILSDFYFLLPFEPVILVQSKDLEIMDNELAVLKIMYSNIIAIGEIEKHKYWLFRVQLPYLVEWYLKQTAKNEENRRYQKSTPPKGVCFNFSAKGFCRYGEKCRFFHVRNPELVQVKEFESKSWFILELRFLDDCKYPGDVPLISFLAEDQNFSKIICLRVTRCLIFEARNRALLGYPYVQHLIELLRDKNRILYWLHDERESQLTIDPQKSVFKFEETDGREKNAYFTNYRENEEAVVNRDAAIISNFVSTIHDYKYKEIFRQRQQLPAWKLQNNILDELKNSQVVVIVGDTGCGKTTQIPQFILDDWLYAAAGLSSSKVNQERVEIICTEPRRLSAISVAMRVAHERIERCGETVGYQIRLESCTSSLTKLLFCTTGILLKKLESDPLMKSVTHVIVDEVHERSEESDFLLLILKEIMKIRTDLKIILMSATLNAELFSAYFNGAPLIEIPGKMYPVTEIYLEEILERIDYSIDEYSRYCRKVNKSMSRQIDSLECDSSGYISTGALIGISISTPDECLSPQQLFYRYKDFSKRTKKSILLLDSEKLDVDLIVTVLNWIVDGDHKYPRQGSILVFLPGLSDIMAVNDALNKHPVLSPRQGHFVIIPLHSSISSEEQNSVFRKYGSGVRKIVLSTNIAETSITIDDCVFVVDSGKMKETRFDSDKNMSSLETVWISRANAKQRMGRAGRVMPGLCIRLYTRLRHDHILAPQPVPEIQRVALDQVILRTRTLDNFKHKTISEVLGEVPQAPDLNSIESSIERLKNLGALDKNQELTALGQHLAALPVDVKIGKLILFGALFCCLDSVLTIAASLNKSPFVTPFNKREEAEKKKKKFAMNNSDHLTVLNAYKQWHSLASSKRHFGRRFAEENYLSWKTLEMMGDLKHQYLDLLVSIGFAKIKCNVRRRQHEDCVLRITSREINENNDNGNLLAGILCAALYPNLVKIILPDWMYSDNPALSMLQRHYNPGELTFMTNDDGYVHLHPSSINYSATSFASPYLVFQEKMKTSKIFIHDSTMVSSMSLMLFAGKDLKIVGDSNSCKASLEDGWLEFTLRSPEDGECVRYMRQEFNKLLDMKVKNPFLNLSDSVHTRGVISAIVSLI